MTNPESADTTSWVSVWLLFLAACSLAVHVGKFPAALPLLLDQLDLTLEQSGNLVSIYALMTATCALVAGVIVARIGYVTFAIIGITLPFVGSIIGMNASGISALMAGRAIEGAGWIVGVVALPTIMNQLSTDKDKPVVMGILGAFMPVGGGLMLLASPLFLQAGGWQLAWLVSGCLSLAGAAAAIVACYNNRHRLRILVATPSPLSSLTDLRKPHALGAMLCFLFYSFQYLAVMSYFPTLLVQQSSMSLPVAAFWAAVIMVSNASGNMLSGWFINLGFRRHHILFVAAIVSGVMAMLALSLDNGIAKIIAALLMASFGGLIPGTLFSTAPLLVSSAAGVGIMIGFMLQGAGIGQLTGPFFLSRVVAWTGQWWNGGVVMLVAGVLGALSALLLKNLQAVDRRN